MTGILAQLIALAAYGNRYLLHGDIPQHFPEHHTAFRFCNRVEWNEKVLRFPFLRYSLKQVAADPVGWWQYLHARGCRRIDLYKAPATPHPIGLEHQLAGFVGGAQWYLVTPLKSYTEYWANAWTVTDKENAERKIWSVKYTQTGQRIPTQVPRYDAASIRKHLREVLQEIGDFAHGRGLHDFGEQFDQARLTLDSDLPRTGFYYTDLVPEQFYRLPAEQLLFAAAKAYVFGGMGSWNDVGFNNPEDTSVYERLSAELYAAVNEAIMAAVDMNG